MADQKQNTSGLDKFRASVLAELERSRAIYAHAAIKDPDAEGKLRVVEQCIEQLQGTGEPC